MMTRPKILASLTIAALGAVAAPALAADAISIYATPATTYYYTEPAPRDVESDALATYYYAEPAGTTTYYTAPRYYDTAPGYDDRARVATVYEAPAIVVTAPRLSEDDAITADVVDVIARDPRIRGQVGVETLRNTVTLTGKVGSSRQIDLAGRDAQGVPGVREVNNAMVARVGGSR
jgi:hypothetical protein